MNPSTDIGRKEAEDPPDTVDRGGTRGGMGAIAPSSGHASPPLEGEKRFVRRFLAFIVS